MKLLPSVCFAAAAAGGGSWSYPEDGGNWGNTCMGQQYGSPINLDYTYNNFNFGWLNWEEEGAYFGFNGYDMDRNWRMQDNGHSIVFTISDENHNDSDIQVRGGHLGNSYNFHSFHFHWGNRKMEGGSEHTVNGRHHFAELHMVHYGEHCETFANCVSNDENGVPNYHDGLAVLGAFVELDKHIDESDVNEVLKRLLNKADWLNNNGIDDQHLQNNGNFALADLVGKVDTNAFYRYRGSLTTPGCNEVVRWTVFKDTLKVNRRFARRFLHTVGSHDGGHDLQDNFRGVQDLEGREVTFWSADPSASKMSFANERHFDENKKRRMAPRRYYENNDIH